MTRLRQDLVWAWRYQVFCAFGGAVWMPRTARRLIYSMGGASMQSAPGLKFALAGSPRNLTLGHGVYCNRKIFIEAIAPVSVGNGCALGQEVMILTSHHPIDRFGRWHGAAEGRPVKIGDRVWIGARAIILPGVTIESGVIIAAGAVVVKDCTSGGLYAGVPARRVRDFDQE